LREWRLRGTYLIFGDIEGKLDVSSTGAKRER
jgi:hypothetical protein